MLYVAWEALYVLCGRVKQKEIDDRGPYVPHNLYFTPKKNWSISHGSKITKFKHYNQDKALTRRIKKDWRLETSTLFKQETERI